MRNSDLLGEVGLNFLLVGGKYLGRNVILEKLACTCTLIVAYNYFQAKLKRDKEKSESKEVN